MKAGTIVGVIILIVGHKMLGHYTDWSIGLRTVVLCAVGAVVLTVFGLDNK